MKQGLTTDELGTKRWFKNDVLHKESEPAVEYLDGEKQWFINGKRHRIDGPAITDQWGNKEYIVDGNRHRIDGPAIENTNGDNEYYVDGKLHRLDGPALDYISGHKTWYREGKLHREDGPACSGPDRKNEWYLEGKKVTKKAIEALIADKEKAISKTSNLTPEKIADSFTTEQIKDMEETCEKLLKSLPYSETNLPTEVGNYNLGNGVWYEVKSDYVAWKNNEDDSYHKLGGPAVVYHDGKKRWYKDGVRHREDGPAIEDLDNQQWYVNGRLHRVGGPAIEFNNGAEYWYQNNLLHREDGPAITTSEGKGYYLNGCSMNKYEFDSANERRSTPKAILETKHYSSIKVVGSIDKKKETIMSKQSLGDKFKAAQLEGAKRNVVRTGTDATMNGMRMALLATGIVGPTADNVNTFMGTPIAAGFTKAAVGLALDYVPELKDKPLTKIFSREFRIQGMEDLQDVFLDAFMENLIPAILAAFKEMEDNPSVRVATDKEESKENQKELAEPLELEDFVEPMAAKVS